MAALGSTNAGAFGFMCRGGGDMDGDFQGRIVGTAPAADCDDEDDALAAVAGVDTSAGCIGGGLVMGCICICCCCWLCLLCWP